MRSWLTAPAGTKAKAHDRCARHELRHGHLPSGLHRLRLLRDRLPGEGQKALVMMAPIDSQRDQEAAFEYGIRPAR